jgi:peptidyl-prolyl cis-trans isomerase C
MNTGIGGTGRLFSILGRITLVLVVVGALACRPKAPVEPNQARPTAVEPNKASVATDANKVVVTVDGQPVAEKEVADRVSVAMRQYGSRLANLPPQFAEQAEKQIRQQVLDRMVMERLLDEQVKAAHIEVSEQDAVAEIEKTGARQQPPMTVADFQARVEAQGGNFQEVKDEFRRGIGYRKVLESQWAGKVDATDDEAKQYYDSHLADYEVPEQIRASHILISTQSKDPNADPNAFKAAAKEKAEKLLAQVKAGGDFATLAKENSSCPSAAQGGDLGFFARGQMVKPFEDAAFALSKGQISDLVETEFGYHIITVTDHKDASTTPFEEAKGGIVERLSDEKKNAITKDYLQSLRAKATIIYAPGNEPQPPAIPPAPQGTVSTGRAAQGVHTAQPAAQPTPPAPKAAQPAAPPAPQTSEPASQTPPVQPGSQPAPTTGMAEPNAAKAAPR